MDIEPSENRGMTAINITSHTQTDEAGKLKQGPMSLLIRLPEGLAQHARYLYSTSKPPTQHPDGHVRHSITILDGTNDFSNARNLSVNPRSISKHIAVRFGSLASFRTWAEDRVDGPRKGGNGSGA
jgi:hypothetical protein